jgi:hypothetical protein
MKPATIPNPVSLRALKTDHLGQQLWHDAPFEQGTRNAGKEKADHETKWAIVSVASNSSARSFTRFQPQS